MRVKTRAKQIFELAKKPSIFTCKSQYLFILSHMRSRSSLLSHILGSNPDICGYVEQHNAYLNGINLLKLRADIYLDTKDSLREKYLLDKILHNPLDLSADILTMETAKVIFLIRKPERTFKSIIKNCYVTGVPDWKEPPKVLEYYSQRLDRLADYSAIVGHKALFIESDQLIDRTEDTLATLSDWLNLTTELSQDYSVFRKTGVLGYGDPMGNIKSGKIRRTTAHDEISFPQDLIAQGQTAYDACIQTLSKNVRCV